MTLLSENRLDIEEKLYTEFDKVFFLLLPPPGKKKKKCCKSVNVKTLQSEKKIYRFCI